MLDRVGAVHRPTSTVGLQQVEHEELFVPVVEPTAPLTPGLGYALGAGRRLRQRQLREAEGRLGPRWWESQQFAELERAVEEAFAGPMLGDDPYPTGELVRPFVDHVDGPNRAHAPVWAGVGVVPPPTPVFGVGTVAEPQALERPLALPMPTRRALREQRKAETSARTVAARKLAKGSVLAMTIFGVVASNAPQALHERLFGEDAISTALTPVPGVDSLTAALGASVGKRDSVDDALRSALIKKQQQVQSVSEAGQDAGGVVVAAAKAQAAADAAAARAALDKATREAQRNPRALARLMLADYGWSQTQFTCLDKLWMRESGWRWNARNRSSGAYGIVQALPASKMASAGSDWRTNPATQIEWGLGYIDDRYGTPCAAWAHSERVNWY